MSEFPGKKVGRVAEQAKQILPEPVQGRSAACGARDRKHAWTSRSYCARARQSACLVVGARGGMAGECGLGAP